MSAKLKPAWESLVSKGCDPNKKVTRKKKNYGRWRAFSLIALYVLMIGHFIHWRVAGKTLAPLEFNEAALFSEDGLLTLGFIFMVLMVGSVIVFGRFFCGWACHILALQDFCGWILKKLGLTPKPIRSRFLYIIPTLLFFYMFFWTPVLRFLQSLFPSMMAWLNIPPKFDMRFSDSAYMGSLITEDFWRNLPGVGIGSLTFFVCGFAAVYLLGSRGFCAYVCPYGAMFSWADKFTKGKILLTGECLACGKCSSACKSGVNVMHEVRTYGQVVDTNCFKDMDCVAACPETALSYGFGKPSAISREKPRDKPKTFSTGEEWALIILFSLTLFVLTGFPESLAPWAGRLYGHFPLFLSATLAVFTAVLAIYSYRIWKNEKVKFHRWELKSGKLKKAGWLFLSICSLYFAFLAHSTWLQYHMFSAGWEMEAGRTSPGKFSLNSAITADGHLSKAAGLSIFFDDPRIPRQRGWIAINRSDWTKSAQFLREAVTLQPKQPDSRFQLGWVLAGKGRVEEALEELITADSLSLQGGPFDDAVLKGWVLLMRMNKTGPAMDLLSLASRNSHQDSIFHNKMTRMLLEAIPKEKVIDFYREVVRLMPDHRYATLKLEGLVNIP